MPAPEDFVVDPAEPMAPSLDEWQQMTPAQRQRVMDQLPSEIESSPPPEGDLHRLPKQRGLEALEAFFRRSGRRVYLSSELPVYYPAERMFAPDLIAVIDVEPQERMRWVVAHEGKGLDFALEVTVEGSRKKDLEENVARYARLGIPEYFVFDRRAARLYGWRLEEGRRSYVTIVPQEGRWRSAVLGLELAVEIDRFRFYSGSAMVPESRELLERANHLVDDLQQRLGTVEQSLLNERSAKEAAEARAQQAEQQKVAAEQQKVAAEQQKAAAEQQKAAAERRLSQLEAELERLRRDR